MHGRAVVPHDEVAYLPMMGPDKFGASGVLKELMEQRFAFSRGQSHDVFGEVGADVQRFATCLRVGADNGVIDVLGRILVFVIMSVYGPSTFEAVF